MQRTVQLLYRRAKLMGAALSAGAVFQTAGCSPELSDQFYSLTSTILTQLITSYVNDQLGVAGGFF